MQKNRPKLYFWAILGPFLPEVGQKWFFLGKRSLSVVKYYNCLRSCQKSEITNEPFLRKLPNWRRDRQIDKQRWLYRALRTGSNKENSVFPLYSDCCLYLDESYIYNWRLPRFYNQSLSLNVCGLFFKEVNFWLYYESMGRKYHR